MIGVPILGSYHCITCSLLNTYSFLTFIAENEKSKQRLIKTYNILSIFD